MPSSNTDSRQGEKAARLLHLHLGLRPLVLTDGEVQPDVDDGDQVEEEEGRDQEKWLRDHGAVRVIEAGKVES